MSSREETIRIRILGHSSDIRWYSNMTIFINKVDNFDRLCFECKKAINEKYPEITDISIGVDEDGIEALSKYNPAFSEKILHNISIINELNNEGLDSLMKQFIYIKIESIAGVNVNEQSLFLKSFCFKNDEDSKYIDVFLSDKMSLSTIKDVFMFIVTSDKYKEWAKVLPVKDEIKIFSENKEEITEIDFHSRNTIIVEFTSRIELVIKYMCDNYYKYHKFCDSLRPILDKYFSRYYKPLEQLGSPLLSTKIYKLGENKIYCGYNRDISKDVQSIFNSYSAFVYLSGRSGCGKTSTIVEIGKQVPVIYFDMHKLLDYFKGHLKDYSWLFSSNENYPRTKDDWLNSQYVIIKIVSKLVYSYVIAGFLFLLWRKDTSKDLDDTNFISVLQQINGASEYILSLAETLFSLSLDEDYYLEIYRLLTEKSQMKPVIAFDEIQAFNSFSNYIRNGYF